MRSIRRGLDIVGDRFPSQILTLVRSRPETLGSGRLVCIDGPAGGGKTTLAAALAELVDGVRVVHMDDLYEGWSGLGRVDAQLEALLHPLASGSRGSYRRYDWEAGAFAETVEVEPQPLIVLEGVGSGASRFADLITVLVWVDAPRDVRMARGMKRDGDAFRPHWENWAKQEATLFERERTKERADLKVPGQARRR